VSIDAPVPREQRIEALVAAYEQRFGRRPEGIAEAPGRVNLIGEHVDYNDGLVLPFAIDRSVLCAWARSEEIPGATFCSADGLSPVWDQTAVLTADAHEWDQVRHGDWTDYPIGVLWSQVAAGQLPEATPGFEAAISGDVPQGAGLSSSAALEVAVAGALRDAFSLEIDDVELARLCQRAENEYVGVQCGIMDQFASTLSKRGHALLIDCRTLAYEHVPLRLEEAGLAVVIANSAVKRELASSAYNDRRRECEEAVALLRTQLGRPGLSLRDVSQAELEHALAGHSFRAMISDPGPRMRRARHVVSEIARVAAAVEALRADDFGALGELMGESHRSLRDDYEVSSPQLDLLVGLATAQDYVLGARLTGAGFGGCTVNIVRADAVDAFERDVIAPYRERTGLPAEMYVTSPQDGLRTWRL
jgi:galactokinase